MLSDDRVGLLGRDDGPKPRKHGREVRRDDNYTVGPNEGLNQLDPYVKFKGSREGFTQRYIRYKMTKKGKSDDLAMFDRPKVSKNDESRDGGRAHPKYTGIRIKEGEVNKGGETYAGITKGKDKKIWVALELSNLS